MNALLFTALLIGQPRQAPLPPQAPPVMEEKPSPDVTVYPKAYASAMKLNKPLVVFVNLKVRGIPGAVCCQLDEMNGNDEPRIVIFFPNGDKLKSGWNLEAEVTDNEIRDAISTLPERTGLSTGGGEVRQSPAPFELPRRGGARRTADDEPWLSRAETKEIKDAWPKGVPFGKNLKFYKLEPRYQNLWTENNGTFHGWRADPLHHESHSFTVSGGMAEIDASTWKSVKGLDIPEDAKIDVWKEATNVRAFSLVPRWRWRFPVGTVAYDVLSNAKGEVFEIRTQERTEEGWDTKVTHKDASLAPNGFKGAGQSCASCHNRAGDIVDVPGRIYRAERWGSDGRFSWRPYRDDGTLDERWPLVRK